MMTDKTLAREMTAEEGRILARESWCSFFRDRSEESGLVWRLGYGCLAALMIAVGELILLAIETQDLSGR